MTLSTFPCNEPASSCPIKTLTAGKNRVTFKSLGVDLVADLYLSRGIRRDQEVQGNRGCQSIPQVTDQISTTYGPEMAARGFVHLGIDSLAMGESAYTAICSTQFVEKLTSEHQELVFDQFSHLDFYYKPEAVKASTDATAEFFNN